MDFISLHKRQGTDKNHQFENYLTELVVFMCNISDEFKKVYIFEFLGLTKNEKYSINDYQIKTQVNFRGFDEKLSNRPDFMVYLQNKEFCLCEHKVDSEINYSQLEEYAKICVDLKIEHKRFICDKIIHREATPKGWIELNWQFLYEKLNHLFKIDFLIHKDLEDYKRKNKNSEINNVIYSFLDFLFVNKLYGLDYNYYNHYYENFGNYTEKIINACQEFIRFSDCAIGMCDRPNPNGGSKIKRFIYNNIIDSKQSNNSRIGFYGLSSEGIINSCLGNNKTVIDFQEYKEKLRIFGDYESLEKRFFDAQQILDDTNDFLNLIIESCGYVPKDDIYLEYLDNINISFKVNSIRFLLAINLNDDRSTKIILYCENKSLCNLDNWQVWESNNKWRRLKYPINKESTFTPEILESIVSWIKDSVNKALNKT